MFAETEDHEEIIEALDTGRADLVCPAVGQERASATVPGSDHSSHDGRLTGRVGQSAYRLGVDRVAMQATSEYWKPVFYLWRHMGWTPGWSTPAMSYLPGRPKTDRLDAV